MPAVCINDDIKPYSNGGVIMVGAEDFIMFYDFYSFVRFSLIFMNMQIR